MGKLLLIATVILALVFVASAEMKKYSYRKLVGRRDPFPEPDFDDPSPANISLLTITQRVDNFDPTNTDTWEQRYYMNNEFYRPGFPLFVFLSGGWDITSIPLTYSLMHDMSREFFANMFYLEHRYYGQSRPTPDTSLENLRFLNPEQALADTAHFINHIRSTVEGATNSDVIVVGGHYSASLAVWFRQRYPHLTLAVWASSAPLTSVIDFEDFKVLVGAIYRNIGGDSCYNALESGITAMQVLADAGQFDELKRAFNLCFDLGPQDIPLFFRSMADIFGTFSTAAGIQIQGICTILQRGGNDIDNIAEIISIFVGPGCFWIEWDFIIEADRETAWDAASVVLGIRQWSYTLCSEIGWFQSSTSQNQPFGNKFPVDTYLDACRLVFGESFTPERLQRNSDRFNTLNGGLEPTVTNTIFVNGQLDPWSVIGRTSNLNDRAIAIVIEGEGQSNDLGPVNVHDSPALAAAKLQIRDLLESWINEANDGPTIVL